MRNRCGKERGRPLRNVWMSKNGEFSPSTCEVWALEDRMTTSHTKYSGRAVENRRRGPALRRSMILLIAVGDENFTRSCTRYPVVMLGALFGPFLYQQLLTVLQRRKYTSPSTMLYSGKRRGPVQCLSRWQNGRGTTKPVTDRGQVSAFHRGGFGPLE